MNPDLLLATITHSTVRPMNLPPSILYDHPVWVPTYHKYCLLLPWAIQTSTRTPLQGLLQKGFPLIYSVVVPLVRWRSDWEKSPHISSCSQPWLSVSWEGGTLAGHRNSGTLTSTLTSPHITHDFLLERMQELLQRSSCWQTYLYPRLWDCIFSYWLRPSHFWPKSM